MANTLGSGTYKEQWEAKLQERLNEPVAWMDVAEVIYTDSNVINVPYMATAFSTSSYTRGAQYSYSDFVLTNQALTVGTGYVAPVFVDEADKTQNVYTRLEELATRQAALQKEQIETDVLDDHTNWTNIGDTGGVITSGSTGAITVSATNIDDIVRGTRRITISGNGSELMNRNGLFFVWRAQDFEYLEQFAQANGFNLADTALKNGVPNGYFFMGAYHYISNNHASGHLFAGVRKIFKVGILRTTWGRIKIVEEPNRQSGTGYISRIDYGTLTPTGLVLVQFDINVT